MKKSILFLVLVLLVSAFLLTACNSAQGGEGSTNAAVTGDENLTAGSENATFGGISTPDEPIEDDNVTEQAPTGEETQEPGETTVTKPGETTVTESGETASPTEPETTEPQPAPTTCGPITLPDVPF